MAETTKTNVRQANTKAFVVGTLSEKSLEVKTEEGKTRIEGYLTIKTSDVNFVKFSVKINEKTNAGADNKCYAGIETVMNEYHSIAEVGEEEATKVKVSGDVNLFTGRDGKPAVAYKSNFFNRIKTDDEFEPKAEFTIETYITNISPELDSDGAETGRMTVTGWCPSYNGIEPVELVAEGDTGKAIEDTFHAGQTVEFYGDIINNKIETITEIPVAIGKPRRKVETTYKNDLIINGASEAYEEGVSQEAPYEDSVIEAALQERKNKMEEAKAKAQSGSKPAVAAKPSGAAHGRSLGF